MNEWPRSRNSQEKIEVKVIAFNKYRIFRNVARTKNVPNEFVQLNEEHIFLNALVFSAIIIWWQ